MNSETLRSRQAPLKDKYREQPATAKVTLHAEGRLGEGLSCRVETGRALVEAGLHPATGGSGMQACSGDMLLQALVACSGVTLNAVATAFTVTPAQATSASSSMSPEQSSRPEPPLAGWRPAACSARPVSTLQAMPPSSSVPLALSVTTAAPGSLR